MNSIAREAAVRVCCVQPIDPLRRAFGVFLLALLAVFGLLNSPALADEEASQPDTPNYGIELQRYTYPFEVHFHDIEYADKTLKMAYMLVPPTGELAGTVVLLHGKNFNGAYWERTARDLASHGYRVVIPDQIGFGKSSKPTDYQFSFAGLASNTKSLLDALGVDHATVVGHSMGGMVASRFAIMFPDVTDRLILVNPIGLEDWAQKGVPYRGLQRWYERELKTDAAAIKRYQLASYYDGKWKPEYQPWVDVLAGMTTAEDYPQLALVQAQAYDMIYTQPVVHDFPRIRAKTLLVIGQRDRTALGKDLVDAELKSQLGNYPQLGRAAAEAIPDATLVELDDVGHLPHIEAYDRFITPVLEFLQGSADDVGR